ncbi:MAG: hypothetical protein ACK4TD_01470 [Ectopseudomonas guguanensis]|uniref:hypothetical protein n=1 Tax=Ectopseudomonas guguanensis TaxID=1198456 RepID=UPI003919DF7A
MTNFLIGRGNAATLPITVTLHKHAWPIHALRHRKTGYPRENRHTSSQSGIPLKKTRKKPSKLRRRAFRNYDSAVLLASRKRR